jgi:hypothetical protein
MAAKPPPKGQLRWGRLIFAILLLLAIPVGIYFGLIRR